MRFDLNQGWTMGRYSHLFVAVLIGGLMATGIGHASAQTHENELIVTESRSILIETSIFAMNPPSRVDHRLYDETKHLARAGAEP